MIRTAARVVRRLRPYRLLFVLAVLQVLGIGLLELAKPWPLKVVVDNVLGGAPLAWSGADRLGPRTLLLVCCVGLVGIYAALGVLAVSSNWLTIAIGQRLVNDLRSDLYAHLARLSLAFHSRREVGDLLYRLTADTFAIQTLAMNGVFPIVTSGVLLAGMVVVMAGLNGLLTVVAVAVVPILGVAIARLATRIGALAAQVRRAESALWALAQRTMGAIRVVQAFTTEEEEHRRFVGSSRASLDSSLRLYTVQSVYTAVVNVVIAAGTALVLWLGADLVLDGAMTVGAVLVFTSYLASLYAPVNSVYQTWGLVQEARAGVERVFEILDTEPDLPDGRRELGPGALRGAVTFEAVDFAYEPDRPILHRIDLTIAPGTTVALVGPSGAGKTTLAGLIPRFYDPVRGRVLLDGVDVRELRLRWLRRQVAMVLQPPLVFPGTIRENVAYGSPGARDEDVRRALRLAQLEDFLARVPHGLDTVIGEGGSTVSSGEQLRLTIARALLRDAPLLLLDEPTGALDAETETRVMEGLLRLMAGRTTVVIAHRLSTVRYADTIVVLDAGRVVERGGFAELLERGGPFARLYAAQRGTPDGQVATG